MGSAKVSKVTMIAVSENEKKSLKKRIISFFNKDKKKEKQKNESVPPKEAPLVKVQENPVDKVLERLEKMRIGQKIKKVEVEKVESCESELFSYKKVENSTKREVDEKNGNEESENFSFKKVDDKIKREAKEKDESEFFSYKKIEDDSRSQRIDSQSSEDSGFSEVKTEDDVVTSMNKLKIDEDTNKKKTKTVVIKRAPIKRRSNYSCNTRPYPAEKDECSYRQISQINKHTLTGGQVIVNSSDHTEDNLSEIDIALKSVEVTAQTSQKDQEYWEDVLQLIHDDTNQKTIHQSIQESLEASSNILSDFHQIQDAGFDATIHIVPTVSPQSNPIDEFSTATHLDYEECVDVSNILNMGPFYDDPDPKTSIFHTPPRSETVPSPMSESQASFCPSHSEYTLSPERSSPIYNSDYEKYQDLTPYDESPLSSGATKRDRSASISSMTMKQFKDLQKEMAHNFSKRECCELNRKSCKEILQEHMSKLNAKDRTHICLGVSKMDLKTCYGVLHQILMNLSRGSDQDDIQYALFGLICERVLTQKPTLFAYDFGLSLLKSAALRCPHRSILTRYLVYCVRIALKVDSTIAASKESVFNEVDAQGDNLVIACVRAGDVCAQVLSEIVRSEHPEQPPLFRIHHTNADGYTALHVCCSQHSADSPRLHTAHVLLEHAGADLWKGDLKGGDTSLHLAVNSATCDLGLIMLLFKQIDRKQWKSLAHCRNMSSVTPLEYARSAAKSRTRQNYPLEVLDFLKKCR